MAILQSRTQTGIGWAKECYALVKRAPRKWALLALAYVGVFMMLPSIPGMGVMSLLVWPVFIAMAIRLCRSLDLNTPETVRQSVRLVNAKLIPLLLLGLVCLIYRVLVNVALRADIAMLEQISQHSASMVPAQLAAALPATLWALCKLMLLLLPLMMAIWFSPMLIAFNQYGLVKAVKSSIAGSIQHMVAMSVAWLALTMAMVVLILLAATFAGILSLLLSTVGEALLMLALFSCLLFASALMLAFQYISYRDIFRAAPGM